jgi:ABC-type maltose transport system permease subunit
MFRSMIALIYLVVALCLIDKVGTLGTVYGGKLDQMNKVLNKGKKRVDRVINKGNL